MEGADVPVGAAPGGGLFSNKRNVILVAAAIGGVAGLVILLSRRSQSAPSAGTASTSGTPYTQTDLQLSNIATQLLQFRGEVGKQVADVQTSVDSATQAQQEQNANLSTVVSQGNYNIMDVLNQVYHDIYAQGDVLNQVYQNSYVSSDVNTANNTSLEALLEYFRLHPGAAPQYVGVDTNPQAQQAQIGAGGFDASEFTPMVWDAGDGTGYQWADLMSAGPVRYVGKN